MRQPIRTLAFGMALTLASVITGCANTSSQIVSNPEHLTPPLTFQLGQCKDHTGNSQRDLGREATEALAGQLQKRPSMPVAPDGRYRIDCRVEAFQEGNAWKRWVMPGWGQTTARISVTLIDSQSGSEVLTLEGDSAVVGGGLYSLGADRHILESAAGAVVDKLGELTIAATPRSN